LTESLLVREEQRLVEAVRLVAEKVRAEALEVLVTRDRILTGEDPCGLRVEFEMAQLRVVEVVL
jgi:hypothetical protein